MCSSRTLSRLRALFHVGAWCSDPGTLVLFRLSSGFVSGFGHSRSRFRLAAGACGLEFARAMRSSVAPLHAARSSVLSLVLSCSVLHAACVFSLAACFHVCHVLCEHAAYESSH